MLIFHCEVMLVQNFNLGQTFVYAHTKSTYSNRAVKYSDVTVSQSKYYNYNDYTLKYA